MNDQRFDDTLRSLAGDPAPTAVDLDRSRRALQAAIAQAKQQGRTRRPVLGRRGALVSGLVGSVAVVIVAVALLVSQLGQPTAAEAAFGEIARVAEVVDPLTIPAQQYAYTLYEQTAEGTVPAEAFDGLRDQPMTYLGSLTREMWVGADGTVQMRTTAHAPQFFSAEDEADYYAAGLDVRDGIGKTVTETFTGVVSIANSRDWPTEPDALRGTIVSLLPESDERPRPVQILDSALDLVREPDTPPALRAAALRVIAGLGLDLSDRTDDGGATFTITYDTPERTTWSITIDGAGHLRHESMTLLDGDATYGIPPGTVVLEATRDPIQIVDSLD
jgi:hypothetical protein